MEKGLRNLIEEYINDCKTCTVATASKDGIPHAATVHFENVGLILYFNTTKDSQKVKDIQENPRVFVTMQKNLAPKTDAEISGIQYAGTAKVLSEDEMTGIPQATLARYRMFNSLKPGNAVVVKVSPQKVYLIDYSKGFRHREVLEV